MSKRNRPRRGSLAYTPRKRAKKETPRISNFPGTGNKLLGFAGYKAGMTNVIAVDKRKKSPTSGMEIFIPVTIVETPPLVVSGIRAYCEGYNGKLTFKDAKTKKDIEALKKSAGQILDIRAVVETQPKITAFPKKKPDVMEIGIGGSVQEQLLLAENAIGTNVSVSEILAEGQLADITAVTKGKGFQGVIKRWGVRKQASKASQKRRHIGTGGAWHPRYKSWREPLPGQVGYHTRTEYNKAVLKIGSNGQDVTPNGGFLRYGPVRNDYVMLMGSVPGPAKRLVRFTNQRRPEKTAEFEVIHINTQSKQGN